MTRIVYFAFPRDGAFTGGLRMAMEHVKTLAAAGYDAVLRFTAETSPPAWLDPDCPTERSSRVDPAEAVVLPDDASNAIAALIQSRVPFTVFCQNHIATSLWRHPDETLAAVSSYIACSRTVARSLRERIPGARVSLVPAFADGRVFAPGVKRREIACSPRKRSAEEEYIRLRFQRTHPLAATYAWSALDGRSSAEVAETFARSNVFLSLSRWEGLGLTPLEAMRARCLVAGFTGMGGAEYATRQNGFWANDDDVEAAYRQLCAAVDLAETGGAEHQAMMDASAATADAYGFGTFKASLLDFWEARRR